MSEGPGGSDKVSVLRAERKRVREDVYSLGMRVNAGETALQKELDAAIARSDEIDAEIRRLTGQTRMPEGPLVAAPMYGPPPIRNSRLPRGGFDGSATMYGPPVAPMYGPPPVGSRVLAFLSRLFRRR
jgi:hypothetical protein